MAVTIVTGIGQRSTNRFAQSGDAISEASVATATGGKGKPPAAGIAGGGKGKPPAAGIAGGGTKPKRQFAED